MDPLSSVLSLLKPRSYLSAGLDAGGDWALRFPPHEGIKFNAVTRGSCWLRVDGGTAPVRLEMGDCFLLTSGRSFVLASDLSNEIVNSDTIYAVARDGIASCNGGGDFFLIGSRFVFAGGSSELLLGALPPVVHVSEASDNASVLRWAIDRMATELRERRAGGSLMSEHLAHIMLVQVLRLHVASRDATSPGWFSALSDRNLSLAVGAMHADPARPWSLHELARLAMMSRSSFALRFKQVVGISPMEYLTRWRMLVAAEMLLGSDATIVSVANSVGYESESAFSTAFKRTMGLPPRQYRDETRLARDSKGASSADR